MKLYCMIIKIYYITYFLCCIIKTGDVHVTRICEMRQIESQLGFQADFGLLSDDKAMRYTSKSASLLGKSVTL